MENRAESTPQKTPTVKIKNKNRFGIVPDALIEDKRLSLSARLVASWLVGRADSFEVRIASMQRILGISEKIWRSVRQELEIAGFWKSSRYKGENGIFYWTHEFEYIDSKQQLLTQSSILPKTEDGSFTSSYNFDEVSILPTILPFGMDAEPEDITRGKKKQKEGTNTTTNKRNNNSVVVVVPNVGLDIEDKDKSQDKSFSSSEETQDQEQLQKQHLLMQIGITQKKSHDLAQATTLDQIESIIAYAEKSKPDNIAAYVIAGLEKGWKVPAQKRWIDNCQVYDPSKPPREMSELERATKATGDFYAEEYRRRHPDAKSPFS